VVDRSHRRVSYHRMYRTLFLSNKMISYVAFYVSPIQTGFLMMFQKSYGGTGIVIPVTKSATRVEKTGIRRIPAGIGNLDVFLFFPQLPQFSKIIYHFP
jgi:hypothetical protein